MFAGLVYRDDSCVNWFGQHGDGSFCFDKATENGWCERRWAEIAGKTGPNLPERPAA